ncbi:MAG: CPBP family intramembrane metalloprotease, partial [Pyrinomonadaceae bacterium]|nr:CPBP family intramembrane metalloprotease [Pyrinomonadaceae bacterium]
MTFPDLLLNRAGRLRSGWRLAIFTVVFLIVVRLLLGAFSLAVFTWSNGSINSEQIEGTWGRVAQCLMMFVAALAVGWGCGYALEDLPGRAIGWALHRGWWRDLLTGSIVGAASLVFAALIAFTGGGLRFSLTSPQIPSAVLETTVGSALFFVVAAAAEEILFRGYPLQTLLRAWPAWIAIVPSSAFFALAHLGNPNVTPIFTIINTTLAGVWLAVAYWRVR